MTALLLPVLTGFVGIGTEAGFWLYDQQSSQSVTDAAAFSAATYYQTQEPSPSAGSATTALSQALAITSSYGFEGAGNSSCSNANGTTTCTQPGGCTISAPTVGNSCVEVNNPPLSGPQSANGAAFEVIISQSPQQLFSRVLLSNPVVITARSVAVVNAGAGTNNQSGSACVLVTDTSNDQRAAHFTGNASLNAPNCNLAIDDANDSALATSGNANITFQNIFLANASGNYLESGNSNVNGTVTGGLTTANPYANQLAGVVPVVASATSGGCSGATTPTLGMLTTLSPGYYSSIIANSGNSVVLRSGTYFICPGGSFSGSGSAIFTTPPYSSSGTLAADCTTPYSCTNPNDGFVASDGVTIVLLGSTGSENANGNATDCASFSLSGSASAYLVPPDSGPFSGIIIASTQNCQAPGVNASSGPGTIVVSGTGTTQLTGAVDLPSYSLTYSGSSSANAGTGCLQFIVNSINLSGNAGIGQNCQGVGTQSISTAGGGSASYAVGLSN